MQTKGKCVVGCDQGLLDRAKTLFPLASKAALVRFALTELLAKHDAIHAAAKAEAEGVFLEPAPPSDGSPGFMSRSPRLRQEEAERQRILAGWGR